MFKSIGSTWVLNALQLAAVLVLAPFVLGKLGADGNGVWITIISFTGILSLLILGVPMASVRFIAQQIGRRDLERANAVIATCLGICMALGAAAAATGLGLYAWFDASYLRGDEMSKLEPALLDGARLAFLVVVAQVAFGFALRLPYAVFDAYGDFVARNAIMAGEVCLRFALTIAALSWRSELWVLALVQVVCMACEFAVASLVSRRRHPGIRFSLAGFDRSLVRSILGFSVFALLLNVGALLSFRLDALVIGARLEPSDVTDFDFGNKFFEPLTGLLIAVGAVVMPLATRLQASADQGELRAVFFKWSKICFSIVLVIGLYLLVLGPEFLGAWAGPSYRTTSGPVLQLLMLSFFVYLPVRGVALPLLLGLGKPRASTLAFLATGLLNVAVSLLLVEPYGIMGVALGTAVPNVMFALFVANECCRELRVSLATYASYVAGRACLGALVPLAWLAAIKYGYEPRSMLELFVAGASMVIVFALTWIFFVYRGDPHVDLRALLLRRAAHGKSG